MMIVFCIIFFLLNILQSYEKSFQKVLLSKQAHIYVESKNKDTNHILQNLKKTVKKSLGQNTQYSINFYLEKHEDINFFIDSLGGLGQTPALNTKVSLLGIFPDIKNIIPEKKIEEFDCVACPQKELLDNFYKYKNTVTVLMNLRTFSLFDNFSKNNSFITQATMGIDDLSYPVWVYGIYNDYSDIPTIYINYVILQKWFNLDRDFVSGAMIRLHDISQIEESVEKLEQGLDLENLSISSVLDKNFKQAKVVKSVKEFVSFAVLALLIISLILIIFWNYCIFLDKQPQIRILHNLGIDVSNNTIARFAILHLVIILFSYFLMQLLSQRLIALLGISIDYSSFSNFKVIFLMAGSFLLTFAILLKAIFNIKEKIK